MVEDENTKNPSGLSEFFNALSKEKAEARQKIKEKIADPESGLSSLFHQLEEALQETKNVSVEEDSDNTKLSADDQNKLDVFSNLLNELGSDKETPNEVEPEEILPEEFVAENEEPIIEIIEPQDDIVSNVIRNLDDMKEKTQVKEEVEKISSIRKEFDSFRSFISQQIASLQMSGAGSGEVRLEFLDDVDRDTAKVNNKYLKYNSTTGKWAGADASGSGTSDEEIQDVVGAMFTSNTETGITATYQDGDGTIDLVVGTLNQNTTGTAATVTGGTQASITAAANLVTVGTIGTGVWQGTAIAGGYIANDAIDSQHYADGSIDNAHIADDAIDSEHYADGSIDTAHIADDQVTLAKMAGLARGKIIYGDSSGNPAALALGTSGYVLKSDGTDIAWAADAGLSTEEVQDIAGGMMSGNTESGITVTYQDGDGTVDFTVGTLNQDTTGTADNITVTANNSTDETVYPIFVDGATGSQGAESDTGLSYNPSTGVLTTTSVTGNLTGNVTGNTS